MKRQLTMLAMATALCVSCNNGKQSEAEAKFDYTNESFADIQMLRYEVKGFDELTLDQKKLVYYLQEAALQGRDILFAFHFISFCSFLFYL